MRIAVIGSGISGLVAAYLLSPENDVTVFEANDYIGGHTHTVDVQDRGRTWPVDTGFIVFNPRTYPNFVRLMRLLDVSWQNSNMSFSVQCARTGLVFSPSSLNSLFIQRRNLLRPRFYRMLLDALRFARQSKALLADEDDRITLGQYLKAKGFSDVFRDHFIIPMGEAIWSADPAHFEDFPARYFLEFFNNHGILNLRNQPQWMTIKGGSREYIAPLVRRFKNNIRLNSPVTSIRRTAEQVRVATPNGSETFDHAIIAAHSDQALAMLDDPSDREREILGAIAYQPNLAVLHTDAALLPPQKAAWASWNYFIPRAHSGRVALTYYMNMLQNIKADTPFLVTLNMPEAIDPKKEIFRTTYHHPVYTPASLAARKRWKEISGIHRTHYCGAYWTYGFHEDGVKSALAVAAHFGARL